MSFFQRKSVSGLSYRTLQIVSKNNQNPVENAGAKKIQKVTTGDTSNAREIQTADKNYSDWCFNPSQIRH